MTGDPNYDSVSLLLPFDGANNSTVFRDRSNSRKTIAVAGNAKVSTAQSKFGGASLLLDGTGDYLTTTQSIPTTGAFTLEAWVYLTSLDATNGNTIISQGSGFTVGRTQLLITSTGKAYLQIGGVSIVGTSTIPINTWTHIAAVRETDNTTRIFVDGTLEVSGTNATDVEATGTWVGNKLSGWSANSEFNGYIDDLRITSGVARYTSTFDLPTAPNPIGLETVVDPDYTSVSLLIKADGSTIVDESSSPKTITAVGNAALTKVDSKVGAGSLVFDGTGDYLTIPDHNDFNFGAGNFTVEAWVYHVSAFSENKVIINQRDAGGASGIAFVFYVDSAAKLALSFSTDGTTQLSLVGTTTITTGVWHHVVAQRLGGTISLWLNGTSESGTYNISSSSIFNSSATVSIGANNDGTRSWNGYIDALRVTSGLARYTSTFTPPNYVLSAEFPPPAQGAIVLTGQAPDLYLGYRTLQKSIVLAGQAPDLYLGYHPAQKSIVLTGQAPDLFLGYQPLQESIVLTGQVPVFDNTPVDLAYVTGRGFRSLPGILADSETTTVAGGTFGVAAKVFGGSLVVGTSFKTAPTLTVLADQTGYVTGRGFSTTPTIEVSHDFISTIHGRGFSSKATVVGGSIVVGGAFSTSLTATIDTPISLSVAGQGFQTRPTIVAEYQPSMRVTGRGFVSGIGYSDVTGRGFTQNPILKALETANFAEAFVFNLVPANQEENLYSVSRYQNYPFQHLTRIANDYYGVKADGLYRLTGEYDATEDVLVNGTIKLNEDDLNAFNSQNIPYIYLNGDDDYTATAIVDDVAQPAFSSGFNGRRVKLARGSKGRYWYFKIEGIKSLLGVEYRPEKLARKVK